LPFCKFDKNEFWSWLVWLMELVGLKVNSLESWKDYKVRRCGDWGVKFMNYNQVGFFDYYVNYL
jgi:hypothetical protein